jgi:tetratricopeptide (TPR) repeat protein
MVGRDRELAIAVEALDRSLTGHGGVLTICGEAGIGKSRLLDALVAAARERGVTVLRGAGLPFGGDVPYGAWREAAGELFRDRVPRDAGLTPALRAEALRDLVVERIRRRQPLLIACDDGHWLDDPSRDLLARLARELPALRVLLVVTVRSGEARGAGRLPHGETITLEPLSAADIARLVSAPPEIIARAGGNPLFAEELVNLWHDGTDAALPDTLRAVVTARLDTLPERERAALRIASVIGPRFAPEWLSGADPQLGGAQEVGKSLAELARLDLVRPDGTLHAFKHAITREVAYDTLAVAAREHLHEAVARHIERTEDPDAPDVLEALAHHYTRTPEMAKQRVYLRRAGDAARDAFANAAAIHHYRRLRALLTGPEAFDATLDLAAVLQLDGRWTEAQTLYAEALATADSPHAMTRAEAALGGMLAFTGAYPEAVRRLEAARRSFAALGDRAALAGVLERLAHTSFQQGDDEQALSRASEHAALAHELDDRAGESAAMNTLGLVLWHRGELAPARERLEAALALALAAGHRVGAIHLLNDLAGLLVALGRVDEAVERLGEAHRHAREIGYRRFQGVVVGNAAELFHLAGDDDPALACAQISLQIGAALGDVLQVVHNATVIAAVRRRQGDPAGAFALLERVVAAARASDNRRYLAEALLHQSRARLDLGLPAEAAAAEALAIARAVGQAALADEAAALLAGAPPPVPDVGPPLDATPFLDGASSAPDGAELARRAETALVALNPSNDVVLGSAHP